MSSIAKQEWAKYHGHGIDYHYFMSASITKADTLPNKGEVVLPNLDGYTEEEQILFAEAAAAKWRLEVITKRIAVAKENKANGEYLPPQHYKTMEDIRDAYDRLVMVLNMQIRDIELGARHRE